MSDRQSKVIYHKHNQYKKQGGMGFTIVELTIATAVFATVLLVALTSFVGVGRVYYKGVSLTQTQSIAQQIIDRLGADLQFAPTVVTNFPGPTGIATGVGDSQFICLGNTRYTFNLFQKVNLSDHYNQNADQTKFGLLRDNLPGSSGCRSPFGSNSEPLNKPVELLANKMRLSKFSLTPAKDFNGSTINDLWDMNVTVAYGDDESLQDPTTEAVACDANLYSSQFCSVSNQATTASKRL